MKPDYIYRHSQITFSILLLFLISNLSLYSQILSEEEESSNARPDIYTAEAVTLSFEIQSENPKDKTPMNAQSTWIEIENNDFESAFPDGLWDRFHGTGSADAEWDDWTCWYGSSPDESAGCADIGGDGIGCGDLYPNNMNSWMTYGPFSLEDAIDAYFGFEFDLNSESGADYFKALASVNGTNYYGVQWSGSNGMSYVFDLTDVYQLGNLCGESEVWIAFVFQSNASIAYTEGAQVDEVSVWKYASSGSSDPYEPNDSFSDATSMTTEFSITDAYIDPSGDEDFFTFPIGGPGTLTIDLTSLPDDYDLYLYDPNQNQLESSTSGGTTSEQIIYSDIQMSGYYYIKVDGYQSAYDDSDSYHLQTTWEEGSLDDFYVENATVSTSSIPPGGDFTATCEQHYSGTSTVTLYSKLGYYLSTNSTYGSSDIYLGEDVSSLSSSDTYDGETEVLTIPSGTSTGTYYILYYADYPDEHSETNESNNVSAVQVTIENASPDPEILVMNYPSSILYGEYFDLEVQSRNNGGASDEGSISISFPELDMSNAEDYVSILGGTSSDFTVYEINPGEPINHKNGNSITATDLLVEAADYDWVTDETNTLQLRITPQSSGTFTVRIRSTMHRIGDQNEWQSDPTSGSLDQQGWWVYEQVITINISDPDLIGQELIPSFPSVEPGQSFTARYQIFNNSDQTVTGFLGFRSRSPSGAFVFLQDENDDYYTEIDIIPGTNWYERECYIYDGAETGTYRATYYISPVADWVQAWDSQIVNDAFEVVSLSSNSIEIYANDWTVTAGNDITIQGVVTDESGNPVPNQGIGVEDPVLMMSIQDAATTNLNGEFSYLVETSIFTDEANYAFVFYPDSESPSIVNLSVTKNQSSYFTLQNYEIEMGSIGGTLGNPETVYSKKTTSIFTPGLSAEERANEMLDFIIDRQIAKLNYIVDITVSLGTNPLFWAGAVGTGLCFVPSGVTQATCLPSMTLLFSTVTSTVVEETAHTIINDLPIAQSDKDLYNNAVDDYMFASSFTTIDLDGNWIDGAFELGALSWTTYDYYKNEDDEIEYIHLSATDVDGVTQGVNIWFDLDAPSDPIYITTESLWFNANPILNIDFVDNIRLDKIQYQIDSNDDTDPGNWNYLTSDGSTILPESQDCEDYEMTTNWKISNNDWDNLPLNAQTLGVYHIYFKVTDDAGNIYITPDEDAAFEFKKDIYDPSVNITYPTPNLVINTSNITVQWSVNDIVLSLPMSGVDQIFFKMDDDDYTVVEPPVNSQDYNSLDDGMHTFYIYAIDNAGNQSDEESVEFEIDTQIPLPDFFVENTSLSSYAVTQGETLNASCEQHFGGVPAGDYDPKLGYYLSSNSTIDASDLLLDDDMSSLSDSDLEDNESADVTIPFETNPGTYYILFVADYLDDYEESNENNNVEYLQITVLAAPQCITPSDQIVLNIDPTTADLHWTENGVATTWEIKLDITGFDPAGVTEISVTSNPYTWTGLSASTTYDWYVRADCGSGNYSGWVGPHTFTTYCDAGPFSAPFSENFDGSSSIPDCWTAYAEGDNNPSITINSNSNSPPNAAKLSAFIDYSGTDPVVIFSTPRFNDLTSQANRITFSASSASNIYPDEDNSIIVGTMSDPNDVSTFSAFQTFILDEGYNEYIVNFDNNYLLADEYISFKLGRGECDSPGCYANVLIDDFVYEPIPACTAPSDQNTPVITTSSAQMAWTENGTSTTWEIRLGLEGYDPTGQTPVTVTSNPYTYSGLSGNTSHDWYVRAACDDGSYSDWVGPHTFTTAACNISAATLPYFMGFETVNGQIQYGGTICGPTYYWSYENSLPGRGRARYGTYAVSTNTGIGALTVDRTPAGANNTNYIILTINLSNYSLSSNLGLSFAYASHFDESHPNDKVWVRGSTADDWIEIFNLDPGELAVTDYQQINNLDISAALSGASPPQLISSTFQVRFGQEDGDPTPNDGISFDDIYLFEMSCPSPTSQLATTVTNNAADLSWTENGSSTSWEIKLGLKGFDPSGTSAVVVTTNPYNWTGLSLNTTYDWYVRSDCGSDFSEWSGPHTFTTKPCIISAATLPYFMGFEGLNGMTQYNGTFCGPTYYWSFETDHQGQGRARYGSQAFQKYSGTGAVTLDRTPSGVQTINSTILTIDLTNYISASTDLRLSFAYADHEDESDNHDKVWVRGSDDDEWLEIYDMDPGSQADDLYQYISDLDVSTTLNSATPPQTVSGYFQVKIGQEGTHPTASDGISFDNVKLEDLAKTLPLGSGDLNGEQDNVIVYSFEDRVFIKSIGTYVEEEKEVWIYDAFGRLVKYEKLPPSSLNKIYIDNVNRYLIVKVLAGDHLTTSKVMIR